MNHIKFNDTRGNIEYAIPDELAAKFQQTMSRPPRFGANAGQPRLAENIRKCAHAQFGGVPESDRWGWTFALLKAAGFDSTGNRRNVDAEKFEAVFISHVNEMNDTRRPSRLGNDAAAKRRRKKNNKRIRRQLAARFGRPATESEFQLGQVGDLIHGAANFESAIRADFYKKHGRPATDAESELALSDAIEADREYFRKYNSNAPIKMFGDDGFEVEVTQGLDGAELTHRTGYRIAV